MFPVYSVTYLPGCSLRPDLSATATPHQNLPSHIVGNPSEGSSRGRSGWTRDAQSCSRRSVWRLRRMSEGPSRPRGGSKTARHTALRRGLGPLLPSRSRPLRRPPTRHVPASPGPRDLLPLAWPIFRPLPSTSLVQPARELHAAVCLRALPRQRPRRAEYASRHYHVATAASSFAPRLPLRLRLTFANKNGHSMFRHQCAPTARRNPHGVEGADGTLVCEGTAIADSAVGSDRKAFLAGAPTHRRAAPR